MITLQPLDILNFVIGIILLHYCSNLLIDNGTVLADRYNIPKMIIGMSIVAFGTSLPELVVSIQASFQGKIGLVTGNIIGSNIANIGLVLGLSGFLYKLSCDFKDIKIDVFFLVFTSLVFSAILYFNKLNSISAILLLLILFIYIYILFKFNKIENTSEVESEDTEGKSINLLIIFLILGTFGLSLGSYCLIDGSIAIARFFKIPEIVIGATAIALGTSLPELVASLNAAKKKEYSLVLGNIFGSNTINVLLVFSMSLLINNDSLNTNSLIFDLTILILLTVLLAFTLIMGKIFRSISIVFLAIYFYYISLIL